MAPSVDALGADASGAETARLTTAPAHGGTPGLGNRSAATAVYPQYGTRTSIDALTDVHAEAQLGGASLNTPSRYSGAGGAAAGVVVQYSSSASSIEEADRVWNRWVVVFGFAADPRGLNTILRKFQEFGEIETYRVSNGNYLFLR
jgi:hypothetical protein